MVPVCSSVMLELISRCTQVSRDCISCTWDKTNLVMREWLNHDFIANCHCLKKFPQQIVNFQHKKNNFYAKLRRWIWTFLVVLIVCRSFAFSTWNEPAIFCNYHAHAFFHILHETICTSYFCVRSASIGVDFVLGIKGTLKPGLIYTVRFN